MWLEHTTHAISNAARKKIAPVEQFLTQRDSLSPRRQATAQKPRRYKQTDRSELAIA